jgi:hypothetical protein
MKILEQLLSDNILTTEEVSSIKSFEENKPMSVHWELRSILYLGVLLLISGLGILVYMNLDTIGHQAIIAAIAIACGYCFYYGFKHKVPFTYLETKQISPVFDYVVLLGCLLLGVLLGYLQYQYSVFGMHYGLVTIIPTIIYFISAYIFDHKGILSLGITGLAAWAGISASPLQLMSENNFNELSIILSGIAVGLLLAGFSKYIEMKGIKEHFSFTYNNFAINILFVATLAALFNERWKVISFLFLAGICFYYIRYAIEKKSFLFLLFSILYGYIGLTYSFFSILINMADDFSIILGMFFILASCAGVILFFIYYKRILKIKK